MQRRDKVKIQELIDYWRHRAEVLKSPPTDFMAELTSCGLGVCAHQLELLIKGEPTEAAGYKPGKNL